MLNNISMKLYEAYPLCTQSVNIPFGKLFSNLNKDEIVRNKVKAGQLTKNLCGLKLSNTRKGLEDGFLHTISKKFIQIRTKDARESKSKPILFKKLKRNVSKVSRMAFYFLVNFKHYVDKNFK